MLYQREGSRERGFSTPRANIVINMITFSFFSKN